MSDIVERLRRPAEVYDCANEAADEIESLRAELHDALQAASVEASERRRAHADRDVLVEALEACCNALPGKPHPATWAPAYHKALAVIARIKENTG